MKNVELITITGKAFYKKRTALKLIKQLNWENYYTDEKTGGKWIEEYSYAEMHGGGSPQLKIPF